ncbi:AAA family ATPase [Sphingobium xenophagum]|uniref:AAA+ ATPase domain-containing protein n=1 Tax=Sphingobium xenophagum TaxID=121428 RepID=A0A401IZ01_SPHXE|nr:AAA family ATPase [Sphingobium xenophagum]GBH29575.1 hypothetical protein MBESOW_P0829 [Sphingobium xenophagum]
MMRLGAYVGPNLSGDPRLQEIRRQLFEYLRRSPEERAERRAPIDESFFYSSSVREPVSRRSYGKCVFCESEPTGEEFVDHFRPLRDARDLEDGVDRDFYAWLAYETENLIFVCRECAHAKGTIFPVFGARAPYIATLPEVRRREEPMLLDPFRDHPERELEFLADGWCEPLSDRAQVTVVVLGLNRQRLLDERARSLGELLSELDAALAHSRPSIRHLFDPRMAFVGARLNILRRILQGMVFGGQRFTGAMASYPSQADRLLPQWGDDDRERIRRRIDQLAKEDQSRRRWDGRLPIFTAARDREIDRVWLAPQRTGGISSFRIRNFKGLGDLEITIPVRRDSKAAPCLMILGENAVGKSSILQAIGLALLGGPQARRLRLDPTELLSNRDADRWDQLAPPSAEADLDFRYDESEAFFRLDGESRNIVGRENPNALVLAYGPRRFFDPDKSERAKGAYGRVQTLFKPTATIPYPGTWLNQLSPDVFKEVAQIIRIVLTMSDDDELVRDLDGRICVNLEHRLIPIDRLSDGYRSVFVMIADIVRELHPIYPILEDAEAIVLIDEIETHLHPRWKMRVMSALRRALPNVQFIATTHDPLCLRGMDDGEVVVLQRDEDGRIERLKDLPSLKGMRADQLLTSDYFGLSSTVDPQAEIDMARYVAAVEDLPLGDAAQADALVKHITIGDGAQEQIIHRAMQKFIAEREKPTGALRPDVSREAVEAVLAALKGDDQA